jgi:hypothetical protein
LFDGFVGPVVEVDFCAIEQGKRIAPMNGEFQACSRAGCRCLENGGRGVIDEELIGFEGETQAFGARARCSFGGDQSAKIDAVGQSRSVKNDVGLKAGHGKIAPRGFIFTANRERRGEVVAIGIGERPERDLAAGRGHNLAGEKGRLTALGGAGVVVFPARV